MESLANVSLQFSHLSMFPFFDVAHYLASVMAAREQPEFPCNTGYFQLVQYKTFTTITWLFFLVDSITPSKEFLKNGGAVDVATRSPMASWFSAMLYCFGGGILSSIMLAEPPVAFLSNTLNILLASIIWHMVFFSPSDLFYKCFCFLPIRLMVAGMKEVTRTWKIMSGVTHAHSHFKDAWLVMISIGWAKGAGGGLISNFEQLVRGVWKPESNEFLKMSYPVKVSLIGAVLFTMQHAKHLPIERHNLMFIYTIFLVVTKVTMMLTRSTASPFQPIEATLGRMLFSRPRALTDAKEEAMASQSVEGPASKQPVEKSSEEPSESTRKRQTKKD